MRKKKEITIKVSIGSSVNDTYTLVLNYTGNGTVLSHTGIRNVVVTGINNKPYTVDNSGKDYTAEVTEHNVTVRIVPENPASEVSIDSAKKTTAVVDLSSSASKRLSVKVTDPATKASEDYTVTITYNAAGNAKIKKVTVTANSVTNDAEKIDDTFYATITHSTATITIVPEEPEAEVFFKEGSEWKKADEKTKAIDFGGTTGTKTFEVQVKHKTAAPVTSFVKIKYTQKDYSIKTITVTDAAGNTVPVKRETQNVYSCSLKTRSGSYTVTPADSSAKIVTVGAPSAETELPGGKETIQFENGSNSLTRLIKVKINGQSDPAYRLNFIYTEPDLSISDIFVEGTKLQAPGSNNPYTYTTSKKTVTVKVAAPGATNDSNISINIDGAVGGSEKSITFEQEGIKEIPITVFGYGKEKHYTLKATYENTTLAVKKLTVTSGSTTKSAIYTPYTAYRAAVTEAAFTVQVEAQESGAAITIDGETAASKAFTIDTEGQEKQIPIKISHNGEEKTYTLTVTRVASGAGNIEAKLQTLKVKASGTEQQLNPGFNPDTAGYEVHVTNSVTSVTVEATAAQGIAIEGAKEWTLSGTETIITLKATVIAAPEKSKTYRITVRKAAAGASSNAQLKTFTIKATHEWLEKTMKWDTAFAPATENYTCKTLDVVDQLEITALPEETDGKTFLVKDGAETLFTKKITIPAPAGQVSFKVKVLAPDSTTAKTYTVTVSRIALSGELTEFSGTGLTSFFDEYKNGTTISTHFASSIAATATQTVLTATPKTPDNVAMKIKVGSAAEEDFTSGKTIQLTQNETRIQLRVVSKLTAEGFYINKKTGQDVDEGKTYYLTITKSSGTSNNAFLSKIEVVYGTEHNQWKLPLKNMQGEDTDFAKTTDSYTIRPPAIAKELYITVETEDAAAKITGWSGVKTNYYSLDAIAKLNPPNQIKIEVEATDGTKKAYTITVNQYKPVSIQITAPAANASINVTTPNAGAISGTFVDEEKIVTEIWIGSSALPIQMKHGHKWTKATTIDPAQGTFSGTFEHIAELANGARDIKVVAYNAGGYPVAIKTVPVTITGSTVQGRSANLSLRKGSWNPAVSGSKYDITIKVYDVAYSHDYENVVVYEKTLKDKDSGYFNYVNETLEDIMAMDNRKYKVQVTVTEKSTWDPTPRVVASGESSPGTSINAAGHTTFEVTLQRI